MRAINGLHTETSVPEGLQDRVRSRSGWVIADGQRVSARIETIHGDARHGSHSGRDLQAAPDCTIQLRSVEGLRRPRRVRLLGDELRVEAADAEEERSHRNDDEWQVVALTAATIRLLPGTRAVPLGRRYRLAIL